MLLGRWRLSLLRCEFSVFEVRRLNHFGKRIAEKIRVFAVIESEAHFVKVSREMLRIHFMPRSNNAPLEQTESGFYGIGVNVSMSVASAVVNRAVLFLLNLSERPRVDSRFIGKNHFDITPDIRFDDCGNRFRLSVLRVNQPEVAVALTESDNHFLDTSRTPAASLAAYVGFINLYRSAQLFDWLSFLHRFADAVTEIPRRIVASVKRALNLERRHSLFGFAHKEHGGEPLRQGQVRVMEYRARRDGELIAT